MKPDRADYARQVGLDPDKLPDHVAIIMDGNGRWAQQQGRRRADGHSHGATSARATIARTRCRYGLNVANRWTYSHTRSCWV